MQLRALIQVAILGAQLSSAAPSPTDITPGIRNLRGYIDNVISDVTNEKYAVIANDYSSTGRSLAFLERDILPDGCTYNLPTSASTKHQAVAYLRYVDLVLSHGSFCVVPDSFPLPRLAQKTTTRKIKQRRSTYAYREKCV